LQELLQKIIILAGEAGFELFIIINCRGAKILNIINISKN